MGKIKALVKRLPIVVTVRSEVKMVKWLFVLGLSVHMTALQGEYQAKDFSSLLGKTPGLSAELVSMHLKLYQGYVRNANALIDQIAGLRQSGEDRTLTYGALERRLAWEMNGMMLHELYFGNLGVKPPLKQQDGLYQQIVRDFGSFARWQQNFIATGMIRGIGWVVLYGDPLQKRLYNLWIDDHNINVLAGGVPLLVMDVWEHAYLTEYGLNRARYLAAFFRNVNWSVVKERWSAFTRKDHFVDKHALTRQP